jgi:hypothetical protein
LVIFSPFNAVDTILYVGFSLGIHLGFGRERGVALVVAFLLSVSAAQQPPVARFDAGANRQRMATKSLQQSVGIRKLTRGRDGSGSASLVREI